MATTDLRAAPDGKGGGRKRLLVVPTGVHRKKVATKALGPVILFVD